MKQNPLCGIKSTVPLSLTAFHNTARSYASNNAFLCNGRTRNDLLIRIIVFDRPARGGAISATCYRFTPDNGSLKTHFADFFPFKAFINIYKLYYNILFSICQGGKYFYYGFLARAPLKALPETKCRVSSTSDKVLGR